jgi:pimeloyl-ACP methyl ester carboxylesterase
LSVNTTGVLQSIFEFDPSVVILAYSWIDDSATDSGDLNLDEVYGSEAYTHVNGMRLANALEQAVAPSFWTAPNALLRLIGHSHGSKVATVAALTLQQRGRRVAHLTILDSPESDTPLEVNGANLLGFYLEQMQITNPSSGYGGGPFVDNYASYFGVSYAGTSNLQNVVEVALDPSTLYHFDDVSGRHSYAAAWYGGAAAGAASQSEPPLGVAWPPSPLTYLPALNQSWPTGTNQFSQWNLQAGSSIHDVFSYDTEALAVSTLGTQGNVQVSSSGTVTFGPAAGSWPAYSIFQGSYTNPGSGDGYGIAFDIVWTAPQVGDYFVVTMEERGLTGAQEVLLVMDGQSFPAGQTSVAINDGAYGSSLLIYMYFAAAPGNTYGQISVSNFSLVEVGDASGYLRVKRLAEAAERAAKRALRAPKR